MTSVFDMLPTREDGTTITPWDPEWEKITNIGNVHRKDDDHLILYEAHWSKSRDKVEKVWDFKEAIKTGEKVDAGLMLMYVKGGYRELFDRIYGPREGEERPGASSDGADHGPDVD